MDTKALANVRVGVACGLVGAIMALGLAVGSSSVAVAGAEPNTYQDITAFDRCIRIGGLHSCIWRTMRGKGGPAGPGPAAAARAYQSADSAVNWASEPRRS
jgi:hypothetical protein